MIVCAVLDPMNKKDDMLIYQVCVLKLNTLDTLTHAHAHAHVHVRTA